MKLIKYAYCKNCGKKFKTPYTQQLFCGQICRSLTEKKEILMTPKKPRIKKKCCVCGIEFESNNVSLFCSETCRNLDRTQKRNEKWAKRAPTERKRKHNEQNMFFNDLKDQPYAPGLKRFKACRG